MDAHEEDIFYSDDELSDSEEIYQVRIIKKLKENAKIRFSVINPKFYMAVEENKYAIYAYTHGPLTGSGSLLVELRVPPPPSSLIQPM